MGSSTLSLLMDAIMLNRAPPKEYEIHQLIGLEALPKADIVYDTKGAKLYQVIDKQDPSLPVHILELAALPNGTFLVWSHNKSKACKVARQGKKRRMRIIGPSTKGGFRESVRVVMDFFTENSMEAWGKFGILNVARLKDTPEEVVWHIVKSQ